MKVYAFFFLFLACACIAAEKSPQRKVLVELFTSQGCGACPPAEALLSETLAKETFARNTVVLTWHVSYWDYLGWQDTFASKEFTARQRAYSEALKLNGVSTPQIFVGNALLKNDVLETRATEALDDADIAIDLSLSVNGSELRAEYKLKRIDAEIAWPQTLQATPVLFLKSTRVMAKAGENRGRILSGVNVAHTLGTPVPAARALERKTSKTFQIPEGVEPSNLGVVILVEDPRTMRTYACESAVLNASAQSR